MQDTRRFMDRFGFSWQVCEVCAPGPMREGRILADRAQVTSGWLYFFSRATTLVLREYPVAWDVLSWAELEQLRERAQLLGTESPGRSTSRDQLGGVAPAAAPTTSERM